MAANPHARGVVAARAAARLARFVTVRLAKTDLSLPQYRLLAFLDDGGTAHADLAQLLTVSSPSVTALVDGLVARDYVERRKDPEDGRRIGFLLDYENPYVTCEAEYIETVWFLLSRFSAAGLLERGHKVLPWCGRCGTGLSSHEVGQGFNQLWFEGHSRRCAGNVGSGLAKVLRCLG